MRLFEKTSVFVLAVAIGAGITYAQAPDATPTAGGSASATMSVSGSVNLSPSQMSAQAATIEAQTNEDYRHILHLQALARKEKDVLKLNCINDKLVQVKAQLNIFGGFYSALTAALGGTDASAQSQAFGDVQAGGEAIKRLRSEADTCAGSPDLKIESSALVDRPEIPDDPTTWDPSWDPQVDDVEPPGYASPFK